MKELLTDYSLRDLETGYDLGARLLTSRGMTAQEYSKLREGKWKVPMVDYLANERPTALWSSESELAEAFVADRIVNYEPLIVLLRPTLKAIELAHSGDYVCADGFQFRLYGITENVSSEGLSEFYFYAELLLDNLRARACLLQLVAERTNGSE